MKKCNLDIRKKLEAKGIRQWQLADAIGISHWTLTVWLRHELSPKKKQEVLSVIDGMECGDAEE